MLFSLVDRLLNKQHMFKTVYTCVPESYHKINSLIIRLLSSLHHNILESQGSAFCHMSHVTFKCHHLTVGVGGRTDAAGHLKHVKSV